MVTINYAFREISCKIVYYGPGLSGKTTNLQYVHDRVPSKSRGDLISLATETDRTLYFDFLPISVGDIAGFATKFQLYTVPGQVFYNATRKLVLRGVDGIVFVADSQRAKMDENIESLTNMFENLRESGIDVSEIPIVLQYNKRDLPDVASIEELESALNPNGYVHTEASAVNGTGVFDTLKRITKLVLEQTRKRTAVGASEDPVAAASGAVSPAATSGPVTTPSAPASVAASVGASSAREGWRASAETGAATPAVVASPAGEGSAPIAAPRPVTQSASTVSPMPSVTRSPGVHAAQRSLRVRTHRKRSLFNRLFGWLFGR